MLIYNNNSKTKQYNNNSVLPPAKKTTSKHKLTASNIAFLKTLGLKIKKNYG